MSLAHYLLALTLTVPQQADLPFDEEAYSAVERELDVAIENMVKAQTYICSDLAGKPGATVPRGQYDAIDARYSAAVAGAQKMLGRNLNIRAWTNACRTRNPGRQFRAHLRKAERAVEAAERLIANGDKT